MRVTSVEHADLCPGSIVYKIILSCRFQVSNDISSFLFFFNSCEDHFCSRDVFLRVSEVFEESGLTPSDSFGFVGRRVVKSCCLSSVPSKNSIQIWPNLVFASFLNGVTLWASLYKKLFPFLHITRRNPHFGILILCKSSCDGWCRTRLFGFWRSV